MRGKVKNEDSRIFNQTQPTSGNSSCHQGIRGKRVFTATYIRKAKILHPIQLERKSKKINLNRKPSEEFWLFLYNASEREVGLKG